MPTSPKLRLLILFFSLFICAARAPAQTPAPSPAAATPSPTPAPLTVRLNVLVLDKRDAPVGDLRQEDFQVLEDGAAQTITSFAREETPVSYALVMDNTGSMRTQLNQVIEAGAGVMAGNRAEDETAVIRFVSSDTIERVQDFTTERARLTKALGELYVQGGQSAVIDAVYMAARYVMEESRRGENRRRALVLVTDGEDRKSFYKLDALLNLLRASDVQVFAIGMVQDLGRDSGFTHPGARAKAVKLLDTLAEETGGRVFYPKKPEEFQAAAAAIRDELHTQYVIGYTPTNQTRDGKYRKVQVKLADKPGAEKRTVITRAGYVAAPDGTK